VPGSGISLVIPVRDEATSLPALWQSIQAQSRSPDEIVFVDGGSTDDTVSLAEGLADGDPRVRIIEAGDATPGRGRNVGIAAAAHDWVALTDGGIVLDPTWLEELVRARDGEPSAVVVCGHHEPLITSFFARCAALAYVSLLRDTPAGKVRGPFIASSLIHRSAWAAAGGFPDIRASEDLIFFSRLEALGKEMAWAPAAVVWWEPRSSLVATYRRFYAYSTAAVLAGRHRDWHHQVIRKYLLGVPFFVMAVRKHSGWSALPLAGASARVAASIWRRREGRRVAWALNPVQFLGVAFVILVIDVATFFGWGRALLLKVRGTLTRCAQHAPIA